MGKPLTIQLEDDHRLETLKRSLGTKSKVEVLRRALDFLEERMAREERLKKIRRAAGLVRAESARVNREFQKYSRLNRIP